MENELKCYISNVDEVVSLLKQKIERIEKERDEVKAELSTLKAQQGGVWVKKKPTVDGFYAVKYAGGGYGGCGFINGQWNQSISDNKIVAYLDESPNAYQELRENAKDGWDQAHENAIIANKLQLRVEKMEQALTAPFDGVVSALTAVAGAQVAEGVTLARIEKEEG